MWRSWCSVLVSLGASGATAAQESAVLTLGEFSLELRADWEPLTDTVYGFEQEYPLIQELAPAAELARYEARHFRPFLPDHAVALGDTWRIDPVAALPFLRQLHPGATAELHHDSGMGLAAHGGWACLRMLDEAQAEVLLRVHAEFLLAADG